MSRLAWFTCVSVLAITANISAQIVGPGTGGGGGTVTSVAGTANQIIATGTTSVVLSLANPLVTPGPVTIQGGTLTTDIQPLKITWTYNNAATLFNGVEEVLVDSAHSSTPTQSMVHQWFGGVAGTTPLMQLDVLGDNTIPGTSTAAKQQAVGTGAGVLECAQGAANTADANNIGIMCPTSVTSYTITMPGVGPTTPSMMALGTLASSNTTATYCTACVLGTDNSVAGSFQLANNAANAHTVFASGATTSNTIQGPATTPANGDALCSTVPTSNVMTISDCGFVGVNAVTSVSPGAGIAHFAGGTQAVTSSAIVNADITSMAESKLTGSLGATTITEAAASFSITRAGVATANLTAPYVFLNTNSTNNNTSIGLGISTPGTSTGQTTLNVNGAATGGDLTDWGTGGVWTAGVLSAQTIVAAMKISGALALGAATCTTFGTAGGICPAEGTAPTNVSGAAPFYPDSTKHEYLAATNGASSFGMMNRTQPGAIRSTGLVASVGTATLCAASAGACNQAGTYRVHLALYQSGVACTTNTTGGVSVQLTWTDGNGSAHSAVTVPLVTNSSLVALTGTMLFNQTASGIATVFGSGDLTIDTNGTIIQYATTYGNCSVTGTATYALSAAVVRLQ